MNKEFIARLNRTFAHASMAEVARRLGVPHATVRNYFQGRLPSPEVLIKIAHETGISLNWLLAGTGEVYAGSAKNVELGRLIEDRIGEIVDEKLASFRDSRVTDLGTIDAVRDFDVDDAIRRLGDPQRVMNAWFAFDGRECPQDFGVVFFRGWETFAPDEKATAIRDARRVLDRSLAHE